MNNMNLLTIEHLTKSYTERLLFNDTAFSINEGEKVGLIGINGTGKSTLLRIAAGLEEPDGGTVVKGRSLYIRYLPQIPEFTPGDTILDSIVRDNQNEPHFSSVEELKASAKSIWNRSRKRRSPWNCAKKILPVTVWSCASGSRSPENLNCWSVPPVRSCR